MQTETDAIKKTIKVVTPYLKRVFDTCNITDEQDEKIFPDLQLPENPNAETYIAHRATVIKHLIALQVAHSDRIKALSLDNVKVALTDSIKALAEIRRCFRLLKAPYDQKTFIEPIYAYLARWVAQDVESMLSTYEADIAGTEQARPEASAKGLVQRIDDLGDTLHAALEEANVLPLMSEYGKHAPQDSNELHRRIVRDIVASVYQRMDTLVEQVSDKPSCLLLAYYYLLPLVGVRQTSQYGYDKHAGYTEGLTLEITKYKDALAATLQLHKLTCEDIATLLAWYPTIDMLHVVRINALTPLSLFIDAEAETEQAKKLRHQLMLQVVEAVGSYFFESMLTKEQKQLIETVYDDIVASQLFVPDLPTAFDALKEHALRTEALLKFGPKKAAIVRRLIDKKSDWYNTYSAAQRLEALKLLCFNKHTQPGYHASLEVIKKVGELISAGHPFLKKEEAYGAVELDDTLLSELHDWHQAQLDAHLRTLPQTLDDTEHLESLGDLLNVSAVSELWYDGNLYTRNGQKIGSKNRGLVELLGQSGKRFNTQANATRDRVINHLQNVLLKKPLDETETLITQFKTLSFLIGTNMRKDALKAAAIAVQGDKDPGFIGVDREARFPIVFGLPLLTRMVGNAFVEHLENGGKHTDPLIASLPVVKDLLPRLVSALVHMSTDFYKAAVYRFAPSFEQRALDRLKDHYTTLLETAVQKHLHEKLIEHTVTEIYTTLNTATDITGEQLKAFQTKLTLLLTDANPNDSIMLKQCIATLILRKFELGDHSPEDYDTLWQFKYAQTPDDRSLVDRALSSRPLAAFKVWLENKTRTLDPETVTERALLDLAEAIARYPLNLEEVLVTDTDKAMQKAFAQAKAAKEEKAENASPLLWLQAAFGMRGDAPHPYLLAAEKFTKDEQYEWCHKCWQSGFSINVEHQRIDAFLPSPAWSSKQAMKRYFTETFLPELEGTLIEHAQAYLNDANTEHQDTAQALKTFWDTYISTNEGNPNQQLEALKMALKQWVEDKANTLGSNPSHQMRIRLICLGIMAAPFFSSDSESFKREIVGLIAVDATYPVATLNNAPIAISRELKPNTILKQFVSELQRFLNESDYKKACASILTNLSLKAKEDGQQKTYSADNFNLWLLTLYRPVVRTLVNALDNHALKRIMGDAHLNKQYGFLLTVFMVLPAARVKAIDKTLYKEYTRETDSQNKLIGFAKTLKDRAVENPKHGLRLALTDALDAGQFNECQLELGLVTAALKTFKPAKANTGYSAWQEICRTNKQGEVQASVVHTGDKVALHLARSRSHLFGKDGKTVLVAQGRAAIHKSDGQVCETTADVHEVIIHHATH